MSFTTNDRAGPLPLSATSSKFPLRLRPGNVSRRRSRSFSGWSPSQQHPKPLPPPTKDDLLATPNHRPSTSTSTSAKQAKLSIYPASGGNPTPAPTTSIPFRQRLASFSKLRIPLATPSANGPTQFIYRPFKSKQDVRSPNTATEIEGRTTGVTPRPSCESEYAATIYGSEDERAEPPMISPNIMDLPSPTAETSNGMKRFVKGLKGIPAMLSPKSPSFRRVTNFVRGDREKQPETVPMTAPIQENTPIDSNILRFSYDPATRRVTGLENWRNFFPTSSSDPFQNHQISEHPFAGEESQKQASEKSAILRRIGQRLAELIGSAGARVPASFTVEVSTPEDVVFPSSEPHPISTPFNVGHPVSVKSDPLTGRLVGMPSEWSNGQEKANGRRRHHQSVIISEVISASSLSRYLKPAPIPDAIHSPPEERVSYVPISEPTESHEAVPPTPGPSTKEPSTTHTTSHRKPAPMLSPSERKPSNATSSRHKRNPSYQPTPSPPAVRTRTRSVTVSGTMLQRLNKPLPPLPTDD